MCVCVYMCVQNDCSSYSTSLGCAASATVKSLDRLHLFTSMSGIVLLSFLFARTHMYAHTMSPLIFHAIESWHGTVAVMCSYSSWLLPVSSFRRFCRAWLHHWIFWMLNLLCIFYRVCTFIIAMFFSHPEKQNLRQRVFPTIYGVNMKNLVVGKQKKHYTYIFFYNGFHCTENKCRLGGVGKNLV